MKKEQLNMFVIGGAIIITFGLIAYTQNNHSDQAELMTQNESSYESEVTGTDGREVESTVSTEGLRTSDGVTHADAQGVPDLSNVKNTNDSPMNDERSSDTYHTFQSSHVPYSRSIADVFPVTGTPAYRLEYRFSGQFEDKYSEEVYADYRIGDRIDGCPSDYSVTISLTKFDLSSKKYTPIVDDFCLEASGFGFVTGFYPVWSRDERYVAFVDESTFNFDIFNRETAQKLLFIDTKNLQEGVQVMSLLGLGYSYDPELAFNFSTVRKTEDGHIQVVGIGTWDYQRDGYVFVFDLTDWSLKQILNIEPNDDVLMGAEWAGERAIRAYTVSADIVKKCEDAILDPIRKSSGGKITSQAYTPEYYSCRKINASNFTQMKTHTIPF